MTAFDNDNYDKALPAANKIFSATARKSDERYPEEEKLVRPRFPPLPFALPRATLTVRSRAQKAAGYTAQAYMDYVAWEREVKRPDTPLVKALFERAARDNPLDHDVWEAYLEWLVRRFSPLSSACKSDRADARGRTRTQHKIPEKDANLLQVAQRATRFLPSSSTLWTSSLRISVRPPCRPSLPPLRPLF